MSGLRHIRHARLACADDGGAWRGRTLIEDALRTASLGDEGRLLLVRRLDLGRLAPNASATEWSRRCEERFRNVRVEVVPAESAAAAQAPAVMFRDAAALWVALAMRAARGRPCSEWFWRTGAHGWQPTMTRVETLRLCFTTLAELGGLAATAELAAQAMAAGAVLELLESLSPLETARLLPVPALRKSPDVRDEGNGVEPGLQAWLSNSWTATLARAARMFGSDDPRVRWLAATAIFNSRGMVEPERAIKMADELLQAVAEEVTRHPPTETIKIKIPETRPEVARNGEDEQLREDEPPRPEQDVAAGALTDFGGLFFLVPLFARLGAAEMPHGSAWLALQLALAHVARDADDPLAGLLPQIAPEDVPADFSLRWPGEPRFAATWRGTTTVQLDGTGRLPLAATANASSSNIYGTRESMVAGRMPAPPVARAFCPQPSSSAANTGSPFSPTIHPAAAALALGAHRLCRKLTGLGLRPLLRRPARVALTRTHLEVFLRLTDVDLRIRRAALDTDPGWVPWLGRAIAFHYTLEDSR